MMEGDGVSDQGGGHCGSSLWGQAKDKPQHSSPVSCLVRGRLGPGDILGQVLTVVGHWWKVGLKM